MPRSDRLSCAGCDKRIDGGSTFGCTNNLLRLFLSARAMKKITFSDPVGRKCRPKFDNWLRKTRDEFDDFLRSNVVEKISANTSLSIGKLNASFSFRMKR